MSGPNLFAYLTDASAAPAVARIVGTRVFPEMVPQDAHEGIKRTPHIVYTLGGGQRSATYCATDRLARRAITIECYAPKFDECDELAEAVRLALRDFRGMMGDTRVRLCTLETEANLVEFEPGLFRLSRDWTFWYVEP